MSDLVNPLQALINQASQAKKSKAITEYAQRVNPSARKRVSNSSVLILDNSGSMAEYVGSDRKIDILRRAIAPLGSYEILVFNSTCEWTNQIPEPTGGTAMHLAIDTAADLRPRQTLIVSDGLPDDETQALRSAKMLTGIISTLYIGDDSNKKAIAFMRRLARLGAGRADIRDLSLGSIELQGAIQILLPPSTESP
jgi:hypothetical protein